jgi:hypothetical protein
MNESEPFDCVWGPDPLDPERVKCIHPKCRRRLPWPIEVECRASSRPRRLATSPPRRKIGNTLRPARISQEFSTARARGPGSLLHWIIRSVFREHACCGCKKMLHRMDAWGWRCVFHLPEIAAHMQKEAAKRGWRLAQRLPAIAKFGCALITLTALFAWSVIRLQGADSKVTTNHPIRGHNGNPGS